MSLLDILRWPDARLSEVSTPVDAADRVADLVADMFETMYAAPGRGLAAPQVGVLQRVFVMDAGWKDGEMTPLACINPSVVPVGARTAVGEEGCLSVPGVVAGVTRPEAVILRYTDLTGAAQETPLGGAAARIAQHEMDHLDGILHFDRLDTTEREVLLAAYDMGAV